VGSLTALNATCTVRLYCCTDLRREDASAGSAPRSRCSTELLRTAGSTELDASAHACCGSAGERWVTIGDSGFCCCWIERPRRWLSGRLETNINIDNTEGHRVPHPVLTNKLSLVPHGLAHVRLRRPCNYLHRYTRRRPSAPWSRPRGSKTWCVQTSGSVKACLSAHA
jgi:hypothetical protein